MLRSACCMTTVLLASCLTPFAFAAHTHLPAHTTWTLNLNESDFGGMATMKSDTFVIATDTVKWGKFTDDMVDADGKAWKMSWSGPENGQSRPLIGMSGGFFSTNAATDVSVMKSPDGTVSTCNFSTSADKKKFIEKCAVKTPDGHEANQTLVYDRTK